MLIINLGLKHCTVQLNPSKGPWSLSEPCVLTLYCTAQPFKGPLVTFWTVRLNIQKFYVMPTNCINVFCVAPRTNSDWFIKQHQLTGFITEKVTKNSNMFSYFFKMPPSFPQHTRKAGRKFGLYVYYQRYVRTFRDNYMNKKMETTKQTYLFCSYLSGINTTHLGHVSTLEVIISRGGNFINLRGTHDLKT